MQRIRKIVLMAITAILLVVIGGSGGFLMAMNTVAELANAECPSYCSIYRDPSGDLLVDVRNDWYLIAENATYVRKLGIRLIRVGRCLVAWRGRYLGGADSHEKFAGWSPNLKARRVEQGVRYSFVTLFGEQISFVVRDSVFPLGLTEFSKGPSTSP